MLDHTLEEEFADLKPLILCSESADYVQPLDKVLCCAFIGGPGYLTCAGCRSKWNQANRFTGWTDVDISHAGHLQALRAGNMLKAHGFVFDVCFTSVLRRAIRTQWVVLEAMDLLHCQDIKSWRLNERHYGALQGLDKEQTAKQYGSKQVQVWRRSFATRPPELQADDPRHPKFDVRYALPERFDPQDPLQRQGVFADYPSPSELPATESLEDCVARTLPFWHAAIAPAVKRGEWVLVSAHGNSLRGIVKHLDNISDEGIVDTEIPVGTPLIYDLTLVDGELKAERHYYLGEPQVISPPGTAGAGTGNLCRPATFGLLVTARDMSSGVVVSKEAVAETSVAPASNVTAVDGAVRGSPGQVCSESGVCGWLKDLKKVGLVSKPPGSVSGIIQVAPSGALQQAVTLMPTSQARSDSERSEPLESQDPTSSALRASVGAPLRIAEATMDLPQINAAAAEAIAWHKIDVSTHGPLPVESSVYVESVAAVLHHTSFILVDATPNLPDQPTKQPKPEGTDSQGLPPSRDALLGALLPGLDPSQHTLLAMIQARPGQALQQRQQARATMAVAAEGRMACVSGLHGPQAPAVPPDLVEAWGVPEGSHQELQGVEEIMRAVRSSCKVVAIRMPPSPPPATPGIGEPQMADEPAGDEGVPTVATAAPTVAELQQQAVRAPGVQHAVESWQVMAFGSARAEDARRVTLMLQYTGRPAMIVERSLRL